ncbi:hypothetical protein BCR39DRAFT_548463 [Naematelia encephala]|uniref:PHD-type domain-containing protein n=1 Tax=Naematelia encephala TaxID=71784 RepID=A0A1Y2AMZ3_9TREE|nr:hypothetical protein BCR39DRAFT_548463 [Naematelia encephala]
MPRKVPPPAAVAPIATLSAPPPISPLIQRLRTDWRWAGISQFIWMFSDAFGLVEWDIDALERDLDGDETEVLPGLLVKLLYALTYNRQIDRDNVFDHLRKQYLKRAEQANVLGTEDEPIHWATLGLGQKVQILWELCEWQLYDPARFRALLPNEDDEVAWRIDPIGWDKTGNTYYLFDDNRLWIQRVRPLPPAPPRPPKKTSQKSKKAAKRSRPQPSGLPKSSKSSKQRARSPLSDITPEPEDVPMSSGRKRKQVEFLGGPVDTVQALKRGRRGEPETPLGTKGTRSSSRRSNGLPAEASSSLSSPSSRNIQPTGTRVSRRLRNIDDEWQQVPDEWLTPKSQANGKDQGQDNGSEASELSELTDEEVHAAELERIGVQESPGVNIVEEHEVSGEDRGLNGGQVSPPDVANKAQSQQDLSESRERDVQMKDEIDEKPVDAANRSESPLSQMAEEWVSDEVKLAAQESNKDLENFVEWEAICVTLYDWRTYPEQFSKSRDPDEKNLYATLHDLVGPQVIEALTIKEQERLKQEAINNRKRSSRIATRELEKEELLRREKAHREMEERMQRAEKEQDRQKKDEAEALAREKAREERLREREERATARQQAVLDRMMAEQEAKERAEYEREMRLRRREGDTSIPPSEDGSRRARESAPSSPRPTSKGRGLAQPVSERWELNCEICRKSGWNIDEERDVVCCDDCGRWQHTECHDRQDELMGKAKRNWAKVDFRCKECRRQAARKRQRLDDSAERAPQQAFSTNSSPPYPPPLHVHGQSINGRTSHPDSPSPGSVSVPQRSLAPPNGNSPHQPPTHPQSQGIHTMHLPRPSQPQPQPGPYPASAPYVAPRTSNVVPHSASHPFAPPTGQAQAPSGPYQPAMYRPSLHGPPVAHGLPESHGPPVSHGPPGTHGQPGTHGPPGASGSPAAYGPSAVNGPPPTYGPPLAHGPPGAHGSPVAHRPHVAHGPPVGYSNGLPPLPQGPTHFPQDTRDPSMAYVQSPGHPHPQQHRPQQPYPAQPYPNQHGYPPQPYDARSYPAHHVQRGPPPPPPQRLPPIQAMFPNPPRPPLPNGMSAVPRASLPVSGPQESRQG